MTGENVIVQNIFDINFGNKPYGGGTRVEGAWGRPQLPSRVRGGPNQVPTPSHPCPAPIRSIPKIFIKDILQNDIFPGHSSSLMILDK